MIPTIKMALRFGVFIGVANLVWLYLAFFLGLHTHGMMWFQVFMAGWLIVTVSGFILALRAIKRRGATLRYLEGLGAGVIIAAMTAVVAVIAQVGYFKVVHPEWPTVMAEQTRAHFINQGMSSERVEQMVAQSRNHFTLSNYATSSALTALLLGVAISAIMMIFLRCRESDKSLLPTE